MIQSTADSSASGPPRATSLLGALVAFAATACGATVDAPDPPPEDPALVAIRERCPEIASQPRFCLTLDDGLSLIVISPDDGRSCIYDYQNGEGALERGSIAVVGRSRFECKTGTISQYSFVKRGRPAYTYNDGEWSFLEDYGSGMLVTRSDNPHLQFYRSPPDPDSPWLDLWNTTGDEDLPVTVAGLESSVGGAAGCATAGSAETSRVAPIPTAAVARVGRVGIGRVDRSTKRGGEQPWEFPERGHTGHTSALRGRSACGAPRSPGGRVSGRRRSLADGERRPKGRERSLKGGGEA